MICSTIRKNVSMTNQYDNGTVFDHEYYQIHNTNHYVPHFSSSDPSAQSGDPLHRTRGNRHSPFVHLNCSGCLHDTNA